MGLLHRVRRLEERHFDELESKYRALASTWVLATFVGIGFVLTRGELQLPFDRLVAVTAVGVAGSAGIVLLWVMDLLVYHQLLGVVFMQGLALESAIAGFRRCAR